MNLKNYCLVAFVKPDVAKEMKIDLENISNSDIKYVDTPSLFLATFETAFNPQEIKNYLNQVGSRIFFVYEVNDDVSATNIPKTSSGADYYKHLFSAIDEEKIKMSSEIKKDVDESFPDDMELEIGKMSDVEKGKKINSLIDKGVDNLTIDDKKMLKYLSKNT